MYNIYWSDNSCEEIASGSIMNVNIVSCVIYDDCPHMILTYTDDLRCHKLKCTTARFVETHPLKS